MCASCYIYTDTCDSGAQGGDDAEGQHHAPAARAARRAGSGEAAHSSRQSAPAAARARIQSSCGGGGGVLAAARESLFLCSMHGSLSRAREAALVSVEASCRRLGISETYRATLDPYSKVEGCKLGATRVKLLTDWSRAGPIASR
jgi:hypothetical protein